MWFRYLMVGRFDPKQNSEIKKSLGHFGRRLLFASKTLNFSGHFGRRLLFASKTLNFSFLL